MSRKLSFKEVELFVKENSDCELISKEYINIDNKLLFKCSCGNLFETSFYNFRKKNKRQCNSCSGITNWDINSVRKFVEENSECKLLSNYYQNNLTKLDFICGCGEVFTTDFSSFLFKNKRVCNTCNNYITYTFQEVRDFIESNNCQLDANCSYINARTKMRIKCKCGEYFLVTFSEFKFGKRQCNKCSGKVYCDIESVRNYVETNTNCELLSKEYIDSHGKLKFKCSCGEIFERSFANFKRTSYCNKCSMQKFIQKTRKTQEEFENQIFNIFQDEYSVLGKYINHNTKVLIKHNNCGNVWLVRPSVILNGGGCPLCISSKGEKVIKSYLENNEIKHKHQFRLDDCRCKKPLPFDFAIFDSNNNLKCLIEYDGELHFNSFDYFGGENKFKEQQYRDKIKNNYCKQNNIPLLRIPYWDFSNLEEILDKELKQLQCVS